MITQLELTQAVQISYVVKMNVFKIMYVLHVQLVNIVRQVTLLVVNLQSVATLFVKKTIVCLITFVHLVN